MAARDLSNNPRLEEFARRATAKAREARGDLGLPDPVFKGDMWRFYCPLHDHDGRDRSGWLTLKQGDLLAGCHRGDGEEPEAYTERLKAALGWDDRENVQPFKPRVVDRDHIYLTYDRRFVIRRQRERPAKTDGTPDKRSDKEWWPIRFAPLDGADIANLDLTELVWQKTYKPTDDFYKIYYPDLKSFTFTLDWYEGPRLAERPGATAVIIEGERDVDTFNALMDAIGHRDVSGICLPVSNPNELSSAQLAAIADRRVLIMMDADKAGDGFAPKWAGLVWGTAAAVTVVSLRKLGLDGDADKDNKDLSDWVAKGAATGRTKEELARELLAFVISEPELEERPVTPESWKQGLVRSQRGGVKSDSPANALHVWTRHPDLAGKPRRDVFTGEVEVVGPPWGGELTAGAREAAFRLGAWLEKEHDVGLSLRLLEQAAESCAQPYNPLQDLIAAEWDGEPAIGRLAKDVPLDTAPRHALRLWEIVVSDLARKVRAQHVGQRIVLGVDTERRFDLARAMMGERGAVHEGLLSRSHLYEYARRGVLLVQVDMALIANAQKATRCLENMFAPAAYGGGRAGVDLPAPLVIALGRGPRDPNTVKKVDDQCFILRLTAPPLLDALGPDLRAALVEAGDRLGELVAVRVPGRDEVGTVDEAQKLERHQVVLHAILDYATRELPIQEMRPVEPAETYTARRRVAPVRHVVREQFTQVMYWRLYGTFRGDLRKMHAAFNEACRDMGWGNPTISLTPRQAAALGLDLDFGQACQVTRPGVVLTEEKLDRLRRALEGRTPGGGPGPNVHPPEPPTSGGPAGSEASNSATEGTETAGGEPVSADVRRLHPAENPRETAGTSINTEAPLRTGRDSCRITENYNATPSRARARGVTYKRGQRRAALEAVRAILATPGLVGLDFETWPADPRWHGEQAAAAAPRGSKGAAAEKAAAVAEENGRAHKRTACTLQLVHEDGAEAFVQLDPDGPGPFLREAFADVRCTLVAHNAQFDTEVLARHGIVADIECTMVAAKCLYLEAVAEDRPQPVSFSLKDLVAKEFGRHRDKAIRDRDWRKPEALDDEAVEYGLQDARDTLELWRVYEDRLRREGLFDGYRLLQQAILPTAELNMAGLSLDRGAHRNLIGSMERQAENLKSDLDRLCAEKIDNHGSPPKISEWVIERVLETPVKPPKKPTVRSLFEFIREKGGLVPDQGGEINNIDLPKNLVRLDGLSLDDATEAAHEAGYLGHLDWFTGDEGAEKPSTHELVDALREEAAGFPVYTDGDADLMRAYRDAEANYEKTKDEKPDRFARFAARLRAMAGIGWNRTKTGHLRISKGAKLRKAEQLRPYYPDVAEYLAKHTAWNKATKLINAFGEPLARWVDDDGMVRGQFGAFRTVTGRHSCVRPNLQQMPHSAEFRALFRARPGRKLVICDYSQIELRLAAILAPDERLLEVYRANADVHRENAAIVFDKLPEAVTKEERQAAKPIGFLVVYGGGAAGLVEAAGIDLDRAELFLARFLAAYPGLAAYRHRAPEEAARLRHIPLRPSRRIGYDPAAGLGTTAINYPVQGGAASVQMRALRRVRDALRADDWLDAKVAASVHDEIILDAPDDERAYMAKEILEVEMRRALVEVFPEAEAMGGDRLAEAGVVASWAEKE